MYADSSSKDEGDMASLESPEFSVEDADSCLTFLQHTLLNFTQGKLISLFLKYDFRQLTY